MLVYRLLMVAILIYIGHFKPSIDSRSHLMELTNELFLLVQASFMPIFTEFVSDPRMRFDVGWVSVGLICFHVLLSVLLVMHSTFK